MSPLLLWFALALPPSQFVGETPGQAMRLAYTEMTPPMTGRLLLRQARGVVRGREGAAIPQVRLGLFTDAAPHRLVAATITDSRGNFDFSHAVPDGDYRLVAMYPGLCTANIPLRLERRAGNRHHLELVLEYPGLDLCARATAR